MGSCGRFVSCNRFFEKVRILENYILIYFNAIFLEWNLTYIYIRTNFNTHISPC